MVNPLRGFISLQGQLFESIDNQGIEIHDERGVSGLLSRVLDTILGRIIPISISGDTLFIDKISAEEFFIRNEAEFGQVEGSVQDKILYAFTQLCKGKKLPRGLLATGAIGGKEGRELVVGKKHHFIELIDALEKNGFVLQQLRREIESCEDALSFNREQFFKKIMEENSGFFSDLTASYGCEEVQKLSATLIHMLKRSMR